MTRRNFKVRRRRNRFWSRVAAIRGDRRFWGFLRIRRQHINAEEAQSKKRSKRMSLRKRMALTLSWWKKKE